MRRLEQLNKLGKDRICNLAFSLQFFPSWFWNGFHTVIRLVENLGCFTSN